MGSQSGKPWPVVLAVAFLIGGIAIVLSLTARERPSASPPRIVPADDAPPAGSVPEPLADASRPPPEPPPGEERNCGGVVVSVGGGEPLPGVRVVLRTGDPGEPAVSVSSDEQGRFRIGVAESASIPRLLFLHDRFAPVELPADFTEEMRVEMSAGTYVEGAVLAFGEETPIEDARVIVRGPCTTDGRLLPSLARAHPEAPGATGFVNWREVRTDVNGRFRAEGIAGDRFCVCAGKRGYAEIEAEKALQPFDSRSGPIVIHLSPAWTYAIRLVDSQSGEPVRGLSVREVSQSTDRFGRAPLGAAPDFVRASEPGVYVARPFRITGERGEGDGFSITVSSDGYRSRSVEVMPVPYGEDAVRNPQLVELDPPDAGLGGIRIRFLGLPSDWPGPLPLQIELARFDDDGLPFVEKHVPRVEGREVTLGAAAGRHRVRIWPHSVGGPLRRDVEVGEGSIAEIEVRIESCVLAVRAADEEGNALDGVEFLLESGSEAGLHTRVTRVVHDGDEYRLLLPVGTARLVVQREGYLPGSLDPSLVSDRVTRVGMTLRRVP